MDDGPVVLLRQVVEGRLVARGRAQHDGRIAGGIEADRIQPAGRLAAGPAAQPGRSQSRVVQDQGCHIF
jgi:hypothetical protein